MIPEESRVANTAEKPTQMPNAIPRLTGLSVLLVEDSPDNQVLLKIILTKLGAKVDIASNGKEGADLALKNEYDLVLMDIQMPVMDGHEAARYLRANNYAQPILALTAHAMREERERTCASGFSDFLSKPIQREQLIAKLEQYRPKNFSV